MKVHILLFLGLSENLLLVTSLKEFSLARYSDTTVYANNSVININLVGEGFEAGSQTFTAGGSLECHTDDTTCCRGTVDDPNGVGRGEWYYPNGSVVSPPSSGNSIYRTRDHMVIRLNRRVGVTQPSGVYTCVITGAGGINITKQITLEASGERCDDLPSTSNGSPILYTPPRSSLLSSTAGKHYVGTIATYRCSLGYILVGSVRACVQGGMWIGTMPTCVAITCSTSEIFPPANGQVDTSLGTTIGSTASYSCDTGYTLNGDNTRTCGSDGVWSNTQPLCIIVDCGPLSHPANGQVDLSNGTVFGSTASYSCDTGYNLTGSTERTCEADGMWSGVMPMCTSIDCGPLTDPNNGEVDTLSGTTFMNTANYSCYSGYSLTDSTERICGANGEWSLSEPVCEAIDCGPLNDPNNGEVDTLSGTTFMNTANYSCYSGFNSMGSTQRICEDNGQWSLSEPICEPVDCGLLTDPDNGKVDMSSGTTFGSTASYICNSGFVLNGDTNRICGSDGNWESTAPSCLINCGPLTDPANGQVDTSTGTTIGSTASYSCNTGYILSNSSLRTCGAGGQWTFAEPMCNIVNCGRLTDPDNGQVDTLSGTTFGSTASYSCISGYTLNGDNTRTCGSSGVWSNTQPLCNIVNCGPLTDPDNGQVDTSSGTTFGSTASYYCKVDFATRECGADGLWTLSEPSCTNSQESERSSDKTGLDVGVTVGIPVLLSIIIILIVIIILLLLKIKKLKKRLKSRGHISVVNPMQTVQNETITDSTCTKVQEAAAHEYEIIDTKSGPMYEQVNVKRLHPPKGEFELTECVAYKIP